MKKLPYRIGNLNGIMSLEHETMKEALNTTKFLGIKSQYDFNKLVVIVEQTDDLFIHVVPLSLNGCGDRKKEQVREQYLSYMN